MAGKTVKTRIQLKNDTEANWNKAINFIPLRGEPIIYLTDQAHPFFRIKIGDGVTAVAQLPFIGIETANTKEITDNSNAIATTQFVHQAIVQVLNNL